MKSLQKHVWFVSKSKTGLEAFRCDSGGWRLYGAHRRRHRAPWRTMFWEVKRHLGQVTFISASLRLVEIICFTSTGKTNTVLRNYTVGLDEPDIEFWGIITIRPSRLLPTCRIHHHNISHAGSTCLFCVVYKNVEDLPHCAECTVQSVQQFSRSVSVRF